MPSKRDLTLTEYGISKFRFRELYYFCLQYEDMRRQKEACYSISNTVPDGMPKPTDISDPTGNSALRAVFLGEKINLIEEIAKECCEELYPWILEAVTKGKSFDEICPPCYEKKFRKLRRQFYCLLNLKYR